MERPLYPAALLGYRYWLLTPDNSLRSVRSHIWREAVCHASCHHEHPSPQDDCQCGMYAYHTFAETDYPLGVLNLADSQPDGYVRGAVAGFGNVQIHRDGWRAERAQILGLLCTQHQAELGIDHVLKQRYGVPVFTSAEPLIEFANQHALSAPAQLRPEYSGIPGEGFVDEF